jgi:hypothetical protein
MTKSTKVEFPEDPKLSKKFGCLLTPDDRDKKFRVYQQPRTTKTFQYWHVPKIFNQGHKPWCVSYAWLAFFANSPMPQKPIPIIPPKKLQYAAYRNDEYPGEDDVGTSLRGGIKGAIELGQKVEYRWAETILDVIDTLLNVGPMVVGTRWTQGMMRAPGGWLKVEDDIPGNHAGAHAYCLTGVNVNEGTLRVQNSWGPSWGKKGQATMKIDDFVRLNEYGYEACIALEL